MPKAVKKPKQVAPVAPEPPEPPTPTAPVAAAPKDVVYDVLEIDEYSTASPKGPLTIEWQKAAMGWETEKEWQKRMVLEDKANGNANAKPEHYLFGDGVPKPDGSVQSVHCKNLAGEKVVCWHNANNRPFDMSWCEDLVHTVLYGQWAGPWTIPGETVNGETIRISRYGEVLSGQHQMTACILAGEWLLKARNAGQDLPTDPKYPVWAKHGSPFIETIVVKGMSSDQRVLMTVDYSKPRTAADVFYTSEVFRDSNPTERKELCKMLASAVDLMWTRTATKGYRTHPEIVAFLERHKRLLDCVMHLFGENKERGIAKYRLGAGQCAALMCLMGCGSEKTTAYSDEYRRECPPSERRLDWSLWDTAKEFWTEFNSGRDFYFLRTRLGVLADSSPTNSANLGLGGSAEEKLAVLAGAWGRFKSHSANAGPPFDQADLEPDGCLALHYTDLDARGKKLPPGEVVLVELADFLGIDCPEVRGKGSTTRADPDPPPPSQDEIWGDRSGGVGATERLRAEAEVRRAQAEK